MKMTASTSNPASRWHGLEGPVELWMCAEANDEANAIASEVQHFIQEVVFIGLLTTVDERGASC